MTGYNELNDALQCMKNENDVDEFIYILNVATASGMVKV